MTVLIRLPPSAPSRHLSQADRLVRLLNEAGFGATMRLDGADGEDRSGCLDLVFGAQPSAAARLSIDPPEMLAERAIRSLPLDFERLPILVDGESKEVRLWTRSTVVTRFKPTVYSYTANRYGKAPGSEDARLRFAAAVFRRLRAAHPGDPPPLPSAFLAELHRNGERLLVEKLVETCNLEVRIKRFHVGSPVHRYLYTERHPSTLPTGPITRWTRFEDPVICFDWRHPLTDESGNRLADEPLSDDYARLWMYDVDSGKQIARQTFLWLEEMFREHGVILVDLCLLIDRAGKTIYGEISPDCMRISLQPTDPTAADHAAKDIWRAGGSPHELRRSYEEIYTKIFGEGG